MIGAGGLRCLSVNVFSVADFDNVNQKLLVVNGIQDAIATFSYPVSIELS
jgi:hypothetical protein